MLPDEELTQRIIAAAVEVHRGLGPGFPGSVCEGALAMESENMGLPFARQKAVPELYRGRKVGEHRLDFPGEDRVVVEPKAVRTLEPILLSIVRSYLKGVNLVSGLLLNFAAVPLEIKRGGRELSARTSLATPS